MPCSIYDPELDIVKIDTKKEHNPLISVCFEPTNRCQGMCPYCLIERHKPDIALDKAITYVDLLNQLGTRRIGWGGGEPLLFPGIYDLGTYARGLNMGSLLRTSGTFTIDASEAISAFDWVDVSLDSIDPNVFSQCRPGVSFEKLIYNIVSLSPILRVRVSILLTSVNKNSLFETIKWASATGVRCVRIQTLVPRGRAKSRYGQLSVDPSIEHKLIEEAINYAESLSLPCYELKSVSKGLIAILKPNGDIYSGDPAGIVKLGNLEDDQISILIANALGDSHRSHYAIGQ
ncbi:radical SAM protein [Rhodobium gokarnense]|uniref:MoaA/NifB/PqqE/SkfB family radical SAM enzyme n=1 Tax=Rhodobium gokarnense TaxID=364296 RepID=A0ABT3HAK1_9HYPH|nr:radical SAM protein [Rhodobium gokarnense]MCW2307384.1 MoaA/NifB/PqqE/SkfB family radical SAM enzyme [Rhodobium gokarnense]